MGECQGSAHKTDAASSNAFGAGDFRNRSIHAAVYKMDAFQRKCRSLGNIKVATELLSVDGSATAGAHDLDMPADERYSSCANNAPQLEHRPGRNVKRERSISAKRIGGSRLDQLQELAGIAYDDEVVG